MRRTINIWWVIAVVFCVSVFFFWYTNQLSTTIHELKNALEQGNMTLAALQAENAKLEATLKAADSDAYVEDQARNVYDYMLPNEIRFIITGSDTENSTETEVPSP